MAIGTAEQALGSVQRHRKEGVERDLQATTHERSCESMRMAAADKWRRTRAGSCQGVLQSGRALSIRRAPFLSFCIATACSVSSFLQRPPYCYQLNCGSTPVTVRLMSKAPFGRYLLGFTRKLPSSETTESAFLGEALAGHFVQPIAHL